MGSQPPSGGDLHVALVTGSLGEGAGGLASAVRALAEGLAQSGVRVSLFALRLDAAFGPPRLPQHPGIETILVPCRFEPRTRFTWAPRLAPMLARHCRENRVDLIHANGVWLAGSRATARVARQLGLPYVVSPHGHLQPWAMRHKQWKKRLAWRGYGRRILVNAATIQAAATGECDSIRALGITGPVAVVPNIIALPEKWPTPVRLEGDRKIALFLSRIHRSKGLSDLVSAWDRLRPPGWRAVVAGPDEGGHLAQVQLQVKALGLENEFEFVGPVAYAERWRWYRAANLFVLPTYSENFGITVAEALAAELPVITTRAAPWPILAEEGLGWWVEPGDEAIAQALASATALTDVQLRAMGARGRALVERRYSPCAVSETMAGVYRWLIEGGQPPPQIRWGRESE